MSTASTSLVNATSGSGSGSGTEEEEEGGGYQGLIYLLYIVVAVQLLFLLSYLLHKYVFKYSDDDDSFWTVTNSSSLCMPNDPRLPSSPARGYPKKPMYQLPGPKRSSQLSFTSSINNNKYSISMYDNYGRSKSCWPYGSKTTTEAAAMAGSSQGGFQPTLRMQVSCETQADIELGANNDFAAADEHEDIGKIIAGLKMQGEEVQFIEVVATPKSADAHLSKRYNRATSALKSLKPRVPGMGRRREAK